ncbi:MAG TPA: FtsX-like permease family protein [Tepidisphaeraceae bacterium]|jgi:lipoprotein-releasing system permease protein|nr:FtsX-like permease family protein [Tepidisphaeraceae bacterium]
MYKLHLIMKYLRKRRIAWVSLVAVTLCTAMVLIVISVMGGWLRMFRSSFHGLDGDVIVRAESVAVGFPHYQEMIDKIEKLPEVSAAVPTIETFGLINIVNQRRQGVQVVGYPIEKIGEVNNFPESLHRQYDVRKEMIEKELKEPGLSEEERGKLEKELKNPSAPSFALVPGIDYKEIAKDYGFNNPMTRPGMIAGSGLVDVRKEKDGKLHRPDFINELWASLTVVPVDPDTSVVNLRGEQRNTIYWIVDDSRTQVYQRDSATVYVPFDQLQKDLSMNEGLPYTDPDTNQKKRDPARTTEIQIKVKPGVDLNQAKLKIEACVQEVEQSAGIDSRFPIRVETWEESQAVYLNAIENEKTLVTMLFSIISLVAVMLILCIFYMIVMEKTKDIGIIKSVGATSSGVAAIFLGYGAAIGIVGAGLGFLAGFLIVRNINFLHTKFSELTGHPIWDPQVYAFDTIPNTMNPHEVAVILIVAVLASVLGAVIPAIAAARLHPVESLRWE